MTYLEKYREEHPGLSEEQYQSVVIRECPRTKYVRTRLCPEDLRWHNCHLTNDSRCPICWNREIPGTKPTNKTGNNEREDNTMSKKFTKADLRAGYVVRYRNGKLRMVMPYLGGLVLTDRDGQWLNVGTDLNDDLTEKRDSFIAEGLLDVMEVYGLNAYGSNTLHISTDDRILLWKRDEEKPKKTCDDCIHKVVCSHVGMCEHFAEKK